MKSRIDAERGSGNEAGWGLGMRLGEGLEMRLGGSGNEAG